MVLSFEVERLLEIIEVHVVRGLIEVWTVPNDTISYQSISV